MALGLGLYHHLLIWPALDSALMVFLRFDMDKDFVSAWMGFFLEMRKNPVLRNACVHVDSHAMFEFVDKNNHIYIFWYTTCKMQQFTEKST